MKGSLISIVLTLIRAQAELEKILNDIQVASLRGRYYRVSKFCFFWISAEIDESFYHWQVSV